MLTLFLGAVAFTPSALSPACRARFCTPVRSVAPAALVGTQWQINLDIGTVPGTWMPPAWGASGTRATPTVSVAFEDGGVLRLANRGIYDRATIVWSSDVGGWALNGESVIFWLEHGGVERDDVTLEAGRLHFSGAAWGNLLAKKGNLTIKQKKLGWLPFLPAPSEASFLVGAYRAKEEDPAAAPAYAAAT